MTKIETKTVRHYGFFLVIAGDGGPTCVYLPTAEAVRARLSEEFFGKDGPQTDDQRWGEQARWDAITNDDDQWAMCRGQRYCYEENGEDYGISLYYVLEPLPVPSPLDKISHDDFIDNVVDPPTAKHRTRLSEHDQMEAHNAEAGIGRTPGPIYCQERDNAGRFCSREAGHVGAHKTAVGNSWNGNS